jgi:selenide,water dikinase
MTNDRAAAGDLLVLTKPLGTGVITTALKAGQAPEDVLGVATELMTRLNASAATAAQQVGVIAGTDVTGYGLLGHLREVADASDVSARVEVAAVPIIDGAADLAEAGHMPGGSRRNLRSLRDAVDTGSTDETTVRLLADAQTNGGLLLAVSPDRADDLVAHLAAGGDDGFVIGEVTNRDDSAAITLAP